MVARFLDLTTSAFVSFIASYIYDSFAAFDTAYPTQLYVIKHTFTNGIITKSDIAFKITDEMASANTGMTAGVYEIKGLDVENCVEHNSSSGSTYTCSTTSPYYNANKQVLQNAFGTSKCSEHSGEETYYLCSVYQSARCGTMGIYAYENGKIVAGNACWTCSVNETGMAKCID